MQIWQKYPDFTIGLNFNCIQAEISAEVNLNLVDWVQCNREIPCITAHKTFAFNAYNTLKHDLQGLELRNTSTMCLGPKLSTVQSYYWTLFVTTIYRVLCHLCLVELLKIAACSNRFSEGYILKVQTHINQCFPLCASQERLVALVFGLLKLRKLDFYEIYAHEMMASAKNIIKQVLCIALWRSETVKNVKVVSPCPCKGPPTPL